MSLRKILFTSTLVITTSLMVSAQFSVAYAAGKDKAWRVSPRKARIENPIAADAQSIAQGKKIYVQECENCHGKTGLGDGSEAKDLDKKVRDFNNPEMWKQSDGAIFWKIRSGRRPMPSFKKMLSKEEMWHVTNYIRDAFGKK